MLTGEDVVYIGVSRSDDVIPRLAVSQVAQGKLVVPVAIPKNPIAGLPGEH